MIRLSDESYADYVKRRTKAEKDLKERLQGEMSFVSSTVVFTKDGGKEDVPVGYTNRRTRRKLGMMIQKGATYKK